MADYRFRVVLINEFDENTDLDSVKQALAKRFNLSPEQLDKLFSINSIVVKENLNAEEAATYKMAIDQTGARSRIEPMISGETEFDEFIERRKEQRRNQQRPGTGRREEDKNSTD